MDEAETTTSPSVPQLTKDDLKNLKSVLGLTADVVRVVEPSVFKAVQLNDTGEDLGEPYLCFSALGKGRRCSNCISAQAIAQKKAFSKFEFIDGNVYFVTARYLEVDGEPHALELVTKVSDNIGLNMSSVNNLEQIVQKETEDTFIDSFSGAYSRAYFDKGVGALSGRKLALIRIENLRHLNSVAGNETGDALIKETAHELQRCVRISDSVIRYTGDTFAIQFDAMSSNAYQDTINHILKALDRITLEGATNERPHFVAVAVDADGTYDEHAQRAEKMLDEAIASNQPCLFYRDSLHSDEPVLRRAGTGESLNNVEAYRNLEPDLLTGLPNVSSVR